MKSQKSILISGYYGFDNSGDDAILKAIVKDIRDKNSKININVLSKNPKKTEKMYGVKSVNRFNLRGVLVAIWNTNLFISGGGSLLQDVTSTRSLIYYLAIMKITKLMGKPVMVYANGIGPIERKLNKILAKNILNKVDLITLRDQKSLEYVRELGIKNPNIFVTADPVFTLQAVSLERVNEILTSEGIPKDKKMIGVSIRQWKRSKDLIPVLVKAINYMVEQYDVNILLLPMHYPEDLEISIEISELADKKCYVINEQYSVEEIMGIINRFELIIAMRLHSLIYAATQEVPMVGLSYDPKVDGILKSLGMEYICNVEEFIAEDLIDNIDGVMKNKEALRKKLREQDMDLKNKALSNVRMALELLEK